MFDNIQHLIAVNKMEIHCVLRKVREYKGISQECMAYHLNISQNCYHKIESGKVSMKVETLLAAAAVLDTPITDFFAQVQSTHLPQGLTNMQLDALKGGRSWHNLLFSLVPW
ncbi:helix-turn-helix domain-containing protein [Hymenobacter actinosclerus]|nr:helix-turn-helix transcriptional regulator [Hymenobacter actinosclerus]